VAAAEVQLLAPVFEERSHTLVAMQDSALVHGEAGRAGVAYDVGLISYFSKARISDMKGLVNGPTIAAMNLRERQDALRGADLDFLFVTPPQLADLGRVLDVTCYEARERYLFRNVDPDTPPHILLLRRPACVRRAATLEQPQ
jgi:hypothetical protein